MSHFYSLALRGLVVAGALAAGASLLTEREERPEPLPTRAYITPSVPAPPDVTEEVEEATEASPTPLPAVEAGHAPDVRRRPRRPARPAPPVAVTTPVGVEVEVDHDEGDPGPAPAPALGFDARTFVRDHAAVEDRAPGSFDAAEERLDTHLGHAARSRHGHSEPDPDPPGTYRY